MTLKNNSFLACKIDGCDKPYKANHMCDTHNMRVYRHGSTDQTRPKDWGKREAHPLYGQWTWMRRSKKNAICKDWQDFWKFVEDVGEKPDQNHILKMKDSSGVYSKENTFWHAKVFKKEKNETQKEYAKKYQRFYRINSPDRAKNSSLKKSFGITLGEYNRMLSAQEGVCAICKNPESVIDKRNGKPFMMAVDHCHKTKKIRGLLCAQCNRGLGLFRDSIDSLKHAIEYLLKN